MYMPKPGVVGPIGGGALAVTGYSFGGHVMVALAVIVAGVLLLRYQRICGRRAAARSGQGRGRSDS